MGPSPHPGKVSDPEALPRRVVRLLDANLNRAREGLRVLEDTARFVWEDPSLFKSLRQARHALDRATRSAYPRLVGERESARDLGRRMREGPRRNWPGLVAANFRRAQEALRVLEEYGKVFSPGAGDRFKAVRFLLYGAEIKALRHLEK